MIAQLGFAPGRGVRAARFYPAPSLPVERACLAANAIRDALVSVLGATELAIGEPLIPSASAWRHLTRGALVYLTAGRLSEVVVFADPLSASALVRAAFGEPPLPVRGEWSALERSALERILARCALACDALSGERGGAPRAVDPASLPEAAVFFDVRVSEPVRFALGVGLLRPLPPPAPSSTLRTALLGALPLELRAVLGSATLPARRIAALRPGAILRLDTPLAASAELRTAGRRIARGTCGIVAGRAAFAVRATEVNGVPL